MDGGRQRWSDERIDDLKHRVDTRGSVLSQLSEQVARLDERIAALREAFRGTTDELQEDVRALAKAIDAVKGQFDKAVLEEPLSRVRARSQGIVIAVVGAVCGAVASGAIILLVGGH